MARKLTQTLIPFLILQETDNDDDEGDDDDDYEVSWMVLDGELFRPNKKLKDI